MTLERLIQHGYRVTLFRETAWLVTAILYDPDTQTTDEAIAEYRLDRERGRPHQFAATADKVEDAITMLARKQARRLDRENQELLTDTGGGPVG